MVAPETTKFQYVDGVADVTRIDPDNWLHDQVLLDRPGNKDIQLDLFRDYGTNVPLYPQFQAFFRAHRPPTLIVWGKNDTIFRPTARIRTCGTYRCRAASARYRALRPRRQARRHGADDSGLPRP